MLDRPRHRSLTVAVSLFFSSFVCLALFVFRFYFSSRMPFEFILWNLFLAWLPMLSALLASSIYHQRLRLTWPVILACAIAWLLFFPNAPYVITDLTHLSPQGDAPFWYDLILVASYAWTGCFLGLGSLFVMHRLVRQAVGSVAGWVFAVCVVGTSGFGIYLGRFLRWNSWDVFSRPTSLLRDIFVRVRHPFDYPQTFAFSILFAIFFFSLYLMMVALAHLAGEAQQTR
jgi:uncharacterized membrane protein